MDKASCYPQTSLGGEAVESAPAKPEDDTICDRTKTMGTRWCRPACYLNNTNLAMGAFPSTWWGILLKHYGRFGFIFGVTLRTRLKGKSSQREMEKCFFFFFWFVFEWEELEKKVLSTEKKILYRIRVFCFSLKWKLETLFFQKYPSWPSKLFFFFFPLKRASLRSNTTLQTLLHDDL